MRLSKGIWKYPALICLAGWMFFLGILVGRGTAPVTFDTENLSRQLEQLVRTPEATTADDKKVDLQFHKVLSKPQSDDRLAVEAPVPVPAVPARTVTRPVGTPTSDPTVPQGQAVAGPDETVKTESVSTVKVGKKMLTLRKPEDGASVQPLPPAVKPSVTKPPATQPAVTQPVAAGPSPVKPSPVKPSTVQPVAMEPAEKQPEPIKEPVRTEPVKEPVQPKEEGVYTLQIAAYPSFTDAVSKMARMADKGFSSYRVKTEKDGTTWYRVRSGHFDTYDQAREYKGRLEKAGIDAMIIKKENP